MFVNDSITIGDKLTLNVGLRYDHHNGNRADSEALTLDFQPIDVLSRGQKGLINWNNVSPRLGFAFTPSVNGGTLIKGSAGIYWAQNVTGNWNGQIVDRPAFDYFTVDPDTGETGDFAFSFDYADEVLNPDLKNTRTNQFSLGFEQQVSSDISVGPKTPASRSHIALMLTPRW